MNGRFRLALVALFVLFAASRFYAIDADVPDWRIGHYDAFDELFYSNVAFAHRDGHAEVARLLGEDALSNGHQFCNWLQNGLVWLLLAIFGGSYAAFRGSSVLFALGTMALFAWLLVRHHPRRRGWVVLALAYLTVDAGFLLASRIVEPTIERIFALTATLALGALLAERAARSLAATLLLATATVLFVLLSYPTNAFVALGVALAVVGDRLLDRDVRGAAARAGLFAAGAALAVGLYVLLDALIVGTSLRAELAAAAPTLSERSVSGHAPHAAVMMAFNVARIALANSFKTSPALLLALLFALPAHLLAAWQRRSRFSLLVACVALAFVAQTAFLNDYPERKLVIVVPLALLVIVDGADHFAAFAERLAHAAVARRAYLGFVIVATLAVVASWLRGRVSQSIVLDWRGPRALLPLALAAALLTTAAAVAAFRRWRRAGLLAGVAVAAALVPPAIAGAGVTWAAPTFTYRDAMRDLAHYGDGQRFAGGLSIALQLYNHTHAFMSPYGFDHRDAAYRAALARLTNEGRVDFTAGFADGSGGDFSTRTAQALGFAPVREYLVRAGADAPVRVAVYRAPRVLP